MAGWRTVRVFISSTFRDMQAERDHMVRVPSRHQQLCPWTLVPEVDHDAST